MRKSEGISPIILALKDKDSGVRKAAAEALGAIDDPRAVEPLISALKDRDSDVRIAAAEALGGITGQHFGEDTGKWLKCWQKSKGKFKGKK